MSRRNRRDTRPRLPLILRLSEATSTLELWSSPPADVPPHPFVPRDLDEAMARLRDANPRRLRDAADLLGGRTEHDDDGAALVLARAWLDGRLSLHARPHLVGRTDPIESEIINLADLAEPSEPSERDLRPRTQTAGDMSNVATQQAAATDRVEDTATGPTWLEIEVTGELGLIAEDARLTVRLPDGETQTHSMGVLGWIRIEPVARAGACDVWLDAPVMLTAPAYTPGELSPFDALIAHDQVTVVSLATGRRHRVAVTRPKAHVVELSDVGFESDGRILRPDAREDAGGGMPGSGGLSGVAVGANVRADARRHEAFRIRDRWHRTRRRTTGRPRARGQPRLRRRARGRVHHLPAPAWPRAQRHRGRTHAPADPAAVRRLTTIQRPSGLHDADGGSIELVDVQPADLALAQRLMALLTPGVDELPQHTLRLLDRIDTFVDQRARSLDIHRDEVRFSRRELRESTRLSNTHVKVHLGRLVDTELVLVHRARHGRGRLQSRSS